MNATARRRLAWLGAWAALTVAVIVAARHLPLHDVARRVGAAHAGWLMTAVALGTLVLPLWAAEWVRLASRAERPRFGRTLEVVAVSSATLNTVPFFAGETAAVALLVTRAGLSKGAALGVLALDQLLVGIAKLATVAAAAAFAPVPPWVRAGVGTLSAAVLVGLVVLALLAARASAADAPTRLARIARAARAHLDLVRSPTRSASVLALALLKKGAEVGAVLAVQQALGLQLPWWSGVVVVAALGVGTMLPIAPANLGTYEATAFVAYRSLGVAPDAAFAAAAVQHACALAAAIVPGYLLLTTRSLGAARRAEASRSSR